MAKSKTYHSNADGPITVSVPGHSTVRLEPGESFETDDVAVQESLDANSDVGKGSGESRSESRSEKEESSSSSRRSR